MKIEIHFVIDDEKSTYSWIMGKENQTCTSPIGQDSFFLFCQVLALLQSSWRHEIGNFKQEQLIRKTIEQVKQEKPEPSPKEEA